MSLDIRVVTDGLQFPEGPIAMPDGSVLLVEIRRRTLTRVWPDGRKEIVAEIDGGPNGAAIGPDGAVYVVNNGGFAWIQQPDGRFVTHGEAPPDYRGGSVQRVDLESGKVTTLYTECDGRPLRGPNDLIFDRDGGMWITDPGKVGREWIHHGHLLYAKADGSLIRRVRDRMVTPNGVGLSPDQRILYVSETLTARLYSFQILSPGSIDNGPESWDSDVRGPLPGAQMLDSMAVEVSGNVCVGTLRNGGITIFGADVQHLPFPDPMVTNICFGGPDMRDAWVTGSGTGTLFHCRWPRPGLRLNFQGEGI